MKTINNITVIGTGNVALQFSKLFLKNKFNEENVSDLIIFFDEPTLFDEAWTWVGFLFRSQMIRSIMWIEAPKIREYSLAKDGYINDKFKKALPCSYGDDIRVALEKKKDVIDISIEDNGPGIDKTDYDKAIKPFIRLDSSRNQNIPGSGLGLSISQDITSNHGGKLIMSKSNLGGLKVQLKFSS